MIAARVILPVVSDRKIFLSTRGKEVAWNPGEFQPAVSGDGQPEDLEHCHGRRGGVIGTTQFSLLQSLHYEFPEQWSKLVQKLSPIRND
jgi:hypothetical protein